MNSIAELARLLDGGEAESESTLVADTAGLEAAIALLGARASSGSRPHEPVDLQREVVRRFWQTRRVETLRDARLLAFGLGLPVGPGGLCILDDKELLDAALAAADGWRAQPRAYRRCYQGLLWSYFADDRGSLEDPQAPPYHWRRLRDYLHRRAGATHDPRANPDWVRTVNERLSLFSDTPCEGFVEPLLAGDRRQLDAVCDQLGIGPSSWFLRALVQAQVLAAIDASHEQFQALLPAALGALDGGDAWRDVGLGLLLERHAEIPKPPLHEGLRDAVAAAWGAPWHPAGALRWDGIGSEARRMAADWIKVDLIDAFFAGLADGSGPRRAAFWKRYAGTIQAIAFALLADDGGAPGSAPALPRHARAMSTLLRDAPPGSAVMLLTIGCARLVLFADASEAAYGYDLRKPLPFDPGQPLALGMGAQNSLRHPHADLCLFHRDGADGWRQWEQLFAAQLNDRFWLRGSAAPVVTRPAFVDLSDSAPREVSQSKADSTHGDPAWHRACAGEDVHWQTAEAASVPYSRPDLEVLARVHGLRLQDASTPGSDLSVSGAAIDERLALVLERWGFVRGDGDTWRRSARAERARGLLRA